MISGWWSDGEPFRYAPAAGTLRVCENVSFAGKPYCLVRSQNVRRIAQIG
ncbi:MAG: hypothetical protein H8F28_28285 [Fibrella sp.]|nr:hypothetical protein [Armatimonadota bacterium]